MTHRRPGRAAVFASLFVLFSLLLVAVTPSVGRAQSGASQISESKKKLIAELLAISGQASMSEQMADQQTVLELMRIRPSYEPMMQLAVSEQRDLSKDEQQKLLAKLGSFDAFAEKFRARFPERLNFSKILADVYYPLYDEAFSETDLAEMLEFYRTRVGRKTIERMPGIMQRAAQGIDQIVRPIAIGLIQEIVAEQRAELDR